MFTIAENITETVPAREREMWANGFAAMGDPLCEWCGTPATVQTVRRTRRNGQWFYGPARCSTECHDEAAAELATAFTGER